MIKKDKIVTGLDIGSSKIAAISAKTERDGNLAVLAQASQSSAGISRGVITDFPDAARSVSGALKKLKSKVAGAPGEIYVNISGEGIRGSKSIGMIPLALRGREITRLDMARCANAASTITLPFDREIIHRIVRKFSADDQPWIKSPLGLYASRLSCEVYVITADINQIQNIYKCVGNAGYDVKEIVYTGIADGAALLEKEEGEEGALILNMGSSLTEVSIFFDGILNDLDVIPTGANDVRGAILDSAELKAVIARVNAKIQDFARIGGRVKTVTITGGIAFVDSIAEYLESSLQCPVKMGVAKDIRGNISGIDSMKLSTSIGLVKYASSRRETRPLSGKGIANRISTAVVDIFNNYF